MMIDYANVLVKHYPNAKWTLDGELYSGLNWISGGPKPTKEELDALWPEVEKEIINQQSDQKRHAAYVSESDPLFFKAQRGEGTMADWEAKVAEIKARYPKVS